MISGEYPYFVFASEIRDIALRGNPCASEKNNVGALGNQCLQFLKFLIFHYMRFLSLINPLQRMPPSNRISISIIAWIPVFVFLS